MQSEIDNTTNIDRSYAHAGPLLYECTIYLNSHYVKKNNKTIRYRRRQGAGFTSGQSGAVPYIANTIAQQEAENVLVFHMRRGATKFGLHRPISDPVYVVSHFFAPDWLTKQKLLKRKASPPRRINQKAPDLDNIIQGPLDALIKAQVIEDDSIVTKIESRKILADRTYLHLMIFKDEEFKVF